VGGGEVGSGRWTVSDGIVLFASAVLLLSLCLVMIDDAGSSAGASSVATSTTSTLAQTPTTLSPAPTTTTTVPPTTTTTTTPPSTTTTTTTPPPTTTTTSPPTPAPPPPSSSALPAKGQATADGCAAAIAYLSAYSAPGFTFECPGYALGHQAMTCINEPGVCANENLIAIADACAVAYMNEASNSWVMTGASDAPIDPYGACS
jgi:hypothetical protein